MKAYETYFIHQGPGRSPYKVSVEAEVGDYTHKVSLIVPDIRQCKKPEIWLVILTIERKTGKEFSSCLKFRSPNELASFFHAFQGVVADPGVEHAFSDQVYMYLSAEEVQKKKRDEHER